MGSADADNANEAVWEKVSESQGAVLVASNKLQAFGALLERQGDDCEGYTELHGLGTALRELGDELLQVWRNLDPANLKPSAEAQQKVRRRGRRRATKKDRAG